MKGARKDSLTGLYNREGIEDRVHSKFMECIEKFDITDKEKGHFAIVMFDVDYFKAINDLYGHSQGDRTLQELGNILCDYQKLKKDFIGIFGRRGGEEFLLALPYHTSRQAKYIADQIREIVQNFVFSDAKSNTRSLENFITLSMGVSSMDMGDVVRKCLNDKDNIIADSVIKLREESDCALEYAKFLGRNRVEIFEKYLLSEMENLNIVRNFFFRYSHKGFSEIRLFKRGIFAENPDLIKKARKYFQIIKTEINPRDTRTQAVFADNFYRFICNNKSKQVKNKLMQVFGEAL